MSVQWFPGHMHKAKEEIARVLPGVDAVLELLDARIPYSSENPMLRSLGARHPRLTLLTRRDLADPDATRDWLDDFARRGERALALSLVDGSDLPDLTVALGELIERRPSPERPAVALIAGIPNVGKSTLVNRLAGRPIARTGNEPAVTRRQQRIRLDGHWRLLDTPGVLWPRVDNAASGFRLAATGAIRDTAHESTEVAVVLLEQLLARGYGERLARRFDIGVGVASVRTDGDTTDGAAIDDAEANALSGAGGASGGVAILEAIGRQTGCLAGAGRVDFDRAARRVLTDFRSGRLGPVTLETPAIRDAELQRVDDELAERDARRRQRREARAARRRTR